MKILILLNLLLIVKDSIGLKKLEQKDQQFLVEKNNSRY